MLKVQKVTELRAFTVLLLSTVQEWSRRGAVDVKSTLNDLVHLTPLRIPLMNPPVGLENPPKCTVLTKNLRNFKQPSVIIICVKQQSQEFRHAYA